MTYSTIVTDYKFMYRDDSIIDTSNRSIEIVLTPNFIGGFSIARESEDASNKGGPSTDEQFPENNDGDIDIDMEFLREELWWSMTSNCFFIFGSLAYILLALWDIASSFAFAYSTVVYHIIEWAGPIIYMINSAIDVCWANFIRSSERKQKLLSSSRNLGMPSKKKGRRWLMVRNLRKIRKHAAHRRGLLAALCFGVAAFFAVLDLVFYYYGDYSKSMIPGSDRGIVDALSVHMYLMSAIFAVTGRRTRPRTWTFSLMHPDNMEDLGDLFFLIGSLVDVVLCDSHFDDHTAFWSFLSSFLWFSDACFYLRSDLLTKSVYDEVSLLNANGHSSYLSSGSSGSTKAMLLNRFAKASGDQEADERLASIMCKDNESLV